ncbi:hypothetical protein [uncultured Dysosmobacter sp.]|uniref:hypothetical protein n=1 Tax=uncultured Dysosmobacter sp. TaxID=2591384 RepID=UPI00262D8DBD|nr:hypothetical protein [uncultured Dysosmobacter sp.]
MRVKPFAAAAGPENFQLGPRRWRPAADAVGGTGSGPADRETGGPGDRQQTGGGCCQRDRGRSVATPADRRQLGRMPPGASCPAAGIFSGENSVKKIREKIRGKLKRRRQAGRRA